MAAWLLKHPTLLLLGSLGLLLLGAAGIALWYAVRPVRVVVSDRLPEGFGDGFSHQAFEALLKRFVDDEGRVDYDAWAADPAALEGLDEYLAAVARYSPESHPERFPGEADRLAYWLYAYNACVVKGVLLHWPLKSVRDVKAPLDLVSGLGFFGRLWFTLGGRSMSLYELENGVVRPGFPDPRAHFVLNCASGGCPVLRPELPTGDALEPFLAQSAADFVADDANVRIDHQQQKVHLSQIFHWYEGDFLAELTRRGIPADERTLLTYVRSVAQGERKVELERARDYAVEGIPYDWELNAR